MINREFIKEEEDLPSVKCFKAGFEFLDVNRDADNWFLQIETFDPHEPFFAPERLKKKFKTDYKGPILDWPRYAKVTETPEEVAELRANYMALLSLCDELLGQVLDYFDKHEMWEDTALILATDHGFMLGEHDWWAKNRMPLYEEISHIPLFMYHPKFKESAGQRRNALTQTIDLMPTILDLYGAKIPKEVEGKSLVPLMSKDNDLRTSAIFGYWGGGVNLTDGQYTYFAYPKDMLNQDLYQYTLMPTHMTKPFSIEELKGSTLVPPFNFTKELPLLKVPHKSKADTKTHSYHFPEKMEETQSAIYDVSLDPGQQQKIENLQVKAKLDAELLRLIRENDAPTEALKRMEESLKN
jgi:arylsulfatase A-like enzyme